MVSMKNPLAAILDSNRFTGLNYQDWLRNLNLVLASKKLLYAIEKTAPKFAPADISPEELVTLKQWWDDELHSRCHYFDLQDVCIAIGSLATLDLPMVVDLIGIYGLKGPYCTLTTTDWFLQALSVIPRGSWDDVARRFTMIRWAAAPPLSNAAAARRRRHFAGNRSGLVFRGESVRAEFVYEWTKRKSKHIVALDKKKRAELVNQIREE
ncbi:hypothetical protein F511_08728 [Dorcoceras hygrometricum]|uniref:Uncharacterized protein n=1 Tax=Dorcoceras hygrometricum TaxID=472368 RepID=A0A2Z7A379_9LAMI|nr:hypothetical protein F511_08728 [Dorcoceras hygrometricum]